MYARRTSTTWGLAFLALTVALTLPIPPSEASSRWVDDSDDVRGFLDVKAVAHGHDRGRRLKHTLTTFARWRSRELRCGSVMFEFPELNRELIVFYRRGLKAVMLNARTREGIGNPVVRRPTKRRVAVEFPRRWLRPRLDEYEWFARTVRLADRCPYDRGDQTGVFRDRVPRPGRRIVHRL